MAEISSLDKGLPVFQVSGDLLEYLLSRYLGSKHIGYFPDLEATAGATFSTASISPEQVAAGSKAFDQFLLSLAGSISGTVVEIGCGKAQFTFDCLKANPEISNYYALDLDQEALAIASQVAQESNIPSQLTTLSTLTTLNQLTGKLAFISGDGAKFLDLVPPTMLSVIIFTESIMHFKDRQRIFTKAWQALAPSGLFIATDINRTKHTLSADLVSTVLEKNFSTTFSHPERWQEIIQAVTQGHLSENAVQIINMDTHFQHTIWVVLETLKKEKAALIKRFGRRAYWEQRIGWGPILSLTGQGYFAVKVRKPAL